MWGMRFSRCPRQRNQVSMPMKKWQTRTWRIFGDNDDHPPLTGSDRQSPRKSTQLRAFQAGDADDEEPEARQAPKPKKPKTKA